MTTAHIELQAIGKAFAGAVALEDVNLKLEAGEIHGLVGENGAGKSTLGRILAGVHRPDRGRMLVGGEPVDYRSPREALARGVAIVQQEISLIPMLSVLENVLLGAPGTPWIRSRRAMRQRFAELVERTGLSVPRDSLVRDLRIPDQQKVEVLRAVAHGASFIVVDEPTASLTATESAQLLEVLRSLGRQGTSIVYVSHYLDEVLALVKRVTVLRNGRLIRTSRASDETKSSLVTAMLGRADTLVFPPKKAPPPEAPIALEVKGLKRRGTDHRVSLQIRRGEIVGLAGLVGSGRTEVARALFGADRVDAGHIEVNGKRLKARSPRAAIRQGIALLPESRKDQGLLMHHNLRHNVTLPHLNTLARGGWVSEDREESETQTILDRLDVRPANQSAPAKSLSGGNQQKLLFSKWLFRRPHVLLADEPTRGVDVGAKLAIYKLIADLANDGMAVLLISSESEEIIGMAHRAVVLSRGAVVAEFAAAELTERALLEAAFDVPGAQDEAPSAADGPMRTAT